MHILLYCHFVCVLILCKIACLDCEECQECCECCNNLNNYQDKCIYKFMNDLLLFFYILHCRVFSSSMHDRESSNMEAELHVARYPPRSLLHPNRISSGLKLFRGKYVQGNAAGPMYWNCIRQREYMSLHSCSTRCAGPWFFTCPITPRLYLSSIISSPSSTPLLLSLALSSVPLTGGEAYLHLPDRGWSNDADS